MEMTPINGHKLAIAGAATMVTEPALLLMHQGGVGVICGLAVGVGAYLLIPSSPDEAKPASSETEHLDNKPARPSLFYRMLNGKSVRSSHEDDGAEDDGDETQEADTEQRKDKQSDDKTWVPPQFKLDDALDIIHEFNKKGSVYFGDSSEGAIAIALNAMYHVIDVSSSGKGKSNRFRLAMMQMVNTCETYYINPFAANVKAVIDEREIEVWKPIFDKLANKRPVKEGPEIQDLMTSLVEEIAQRNEQEEAGDFSWQDRPIFVFIDELPEVSARCPDAIKLLDKIGRGGRQFCIFCWVASQTALTSEIGQSTAAQANYKTRIYGGGDKTSANRLMKGSVPKDTERVLQTNGAGLTLMLADGMEGTTFDRAPLVTNEALFEYLGLPAFRKEDWIVNKGKGIAQPLRNAGEDTKPAFSPFTLLPKTQNTLSLSSESGEEKGKGKSSKRGKGQYDDTILTAMDELEDDERPLTLNAIAKRAGLTRHQYDDIEEIAAYYGYTLARGTGRPVKEA